MSTTEEKQEKFAIEMAASASKGALVEKITFAGIPILFSCVVYLMSALDKITHDVTVLNAKISLVVTSDNKQAANSGAELAREKLRQDLEKQIGENRELIHLNRERIVILEQKVK
jgi:hypothetical protein